MENNNINGGAAPSDGEIVEEEVIERDEEYTTDILDVLLDEDNSEPIVLMDDDGKQIAFEQVAVIPRNDDGEQELYVILKPIDKMENINDDEAIVFFVDVDEEGNTLLRVEEDEETAVEVFDEYYKLLQAANGEGEA